MNTAAATNRRLSESELFSVDLLRSPRPWGLGNLRQFDRMVRQTYISPTGHRRSEIFGPIWTVLYAMMAVAAWLVWDRLHGGAFPALKLFALSTRTECPLVDPLLRAAKSRRRRNRIIVLWLVIGATTFSFLRIHRLAGYCWSPTGLG